MNRSLKYTLSGLLTVLFLFLAFRGTDFGRLYESIETANYWWVLLVFALLVLSNVFRSWRWRYLLEPIKPRIGLRNLFSGVMIGYLMNNILPRAGELVRPYTLGKLESLPKSAVFGTIVVERIMDMVSFLLLLLILPIVYNGPLRESFPWLEQAGLAAGAVIVVFLVFITTLVFRPRLADGLSKTVSSFLPTKAARVVEKTLRSFVDGFLFVKHPASFLGIFILSFLTWFVYILMMYVAFRAFNLEHMLGLSAAVVVLTISSIGVMTPTPGSTGTYHFFVSQTLVRLFSIPGEVALSYATVTHGTVFVGTTIIGLYFLLHDHVKVPKPFRSGVEQFE